MLYNPVDFSEFDIGRQTFSLTIGRCSRADDQKWHDVCLDSLPKIFRKGARGALPDSRGDGTGEGKARRAWPERPVVELFEPSVQVGDFYRRLDIFIHGSRIGETFGCVIAEAMACGIPVVTLSTPQRKKANAQAELVEHNVTGFVCRWQWQYAGAVIELLQNAELRNTFGRRSYEKAREQFDACGAHEEVGTTLFRCDEYPPMMRGSISRRCIAVPASFPRCFA